MTGDLEALSQYIGARRDELKLSQRELAAQVEGLTRKMLSDMELNMKYLPKKSLLRNLAKALDIPYTRLLVIAGYIDEEDLAGEGLREEVMRKLADEEVERRITEMPLASIVTIKYGRRGETMAEGIRLILEGTGSQEEDSAV